MLRTPPAFFQHNDIYATNPQFCGKPQTNRTGPDYNGISFHHVDHSARIDPKLVNVRLIPLRVILASFLRRRSLVSPHPVSTTVSVMPALTADQHGQPAVPLASPAPPTSHPAASAGKSMPRVQN